MDALYGGYSELMPFEESDREIYVECLLRTMTTNGLMLTTFTPLLGMTDICRDFLQRHGRVIGIPARA